MGGSGVCSFFGGAVATLLGWRWIHPQIDPINCAVSLLKAHLKLNCSMDFSK